MPGLDADDDKYGRKTILDRLGIRYVYQAPFIKSDIGSTQKAFKVCFEKT